MSICSIRIPPPDGSGREVDAKHPTPEAAGTCGVVGRELDQGCGHEHKYGRQLRRQPVPLDEPSVALGDISGPPIRRPGMGGAQR